MNDLLKTIGGKNILFLFPHPDDESYSCTTLISKLLKRNEKVFVLFLSHGAPTKSNYQIPLKIKYSYPEYRKLYKSELQRAIKTIGVPDKKTFLLNYPSNKTIFNVSKIYRKISKIVKSKKINAVFSCPYEGTHPDHEILSYVASAIQNQSKNILSFEYTGYFLKSKKFSSGNFLNKTGGLFIIDLTEKDKNLKKAVFDCYQTQSFMLKQFSVTDEKFRIKPQYDYTKKPTREIYYESWQKKLTAKSILKYLAL